jgi:putative addiction module killer protein
MYIIETTDQFDLWLRKLKDFSGKARILARLKNVELGNLGDHKAITKTIWEFRFKIGPGYRVYYTVKGDTVILLVNGGNKGSQSRDIEKAKKILKELEVQNEKKS